MAGDETRALIDATWRTESRRVLATLIRLLGDFDLAEEALHDAFAAAVEKWPRDGVPSSPRAWLVSTGRFKAIDTIRRRARLDASTAEIAERFERGEPEAPAWEDDGVEDDRLRLIFTCCHPALPPDAQVALTLRQLGGLTTEEIARAYLTSPATIAQRIVRAKAKIRDEKLPYQIPPRAELPARLDTVLQVLYLIFNEGYSASTGHALTRADLSAEAIRLGRLLAELLPEAEVLGLLGLMLLQESRRAARTSPDGDLVLLDDQDRSLWNREAIAEGSALVERALLSRRFGRFTLQGAIAAVHAEAPRAGATDWDQIVGLYNVLMPVDPSPVVALNRAVAVGMRDGPAAGLALIDGILARGELADYHLAHAARAEMCRRLARTGEARDAYARALELARQEPERRFLERRLRELGAGALVLAALLVGAAGCGLPPDRPPDREVEMQQLPETGDALVIRTDFSDAETWHAVATEIRKPHSVFRANLHLVDERGLAGLSPSDIAGRAGPDRTYLFVADSVTMTHPEHPLLVVELYEGSLREFRVIPEAVGVVENNLSLANVDFEEFMESCDADGIFRSVP